MTTAPALPAGAAGEGRQVAAALALLTGVVLAAFAEAVAGSLLALGRADMMGDAAATPDEFAWLDIGYTAAKILGFAVAPWLLTRMPPARAVAAATLALGAASALAALTPDLALLVPLRALQGLAGGAVLVSAQALVFLAFPRPSQPLLQAVFAVGAVVAPATLAPALQGWIIDGQSWAGVLLAVLPISLAGAGLVLTGDRETPSPAGPRPFDWPGFVLLGVAAVAAAYVLSQGSRWDWFEAGRIGVGAVIAVGAFGAFLLWQRRAGEAALIQAGPFATEPFPFAFLVSIVAGASLFGSAFIIPAFAVNVLGFTPLAAGQLLLPGAGPFIAGLLAAAWLTQRFGVPVLAHVPVGVLLVLVALLMLSGASLESGAADMGLALSLRALGLGFLFLALTIMAFGRLQPTHMAFGIAIFDIARQVGGLVGMAALQTMIERGAAANRAVLGANLTANLGDGRDRLAAVAGALRAEGLDPTAAAAAAEGLLARTVAGQATVIAFDAAFFALAFLFVFAAPLLLAAKAALARAAKRRSLPA